MNILIIGGTGLISREITKQLVQRGDSVTLYNRGQRQHSFTKDVQQIIGDRKDIESFETAFTGKHFDAVIDMICYNKIDAASTLKAVQNSTDHLVVCSSVAVYKRPCKSLPIQEDAEEITDTDDFPYAFHKSEMERFFSGNTSRPVPVTMIRPSLTFGPGGSNIGVLRQNYGIIERIKKGKPLVMFGDGKTPMSFTFTPDLAKGFIGVLGNAAAFSNTYHITSEFRNLWEDLYLEYGKILNKQPQLAYIPTDYLYSSDPAQFAHIHFEKQFAAIYDNSKIRQAIPGFKAEIDLNSGLKMMLQWYEENSVCADPEKDEFEDKLVELAGSFKKML